MPTLADQKARNKEKRGEIDELIADAKDPRRKPASVSRKKFVTTAQYERIKPKILHRAELPEETLAAFIAAIKEYYPEINFNAARSKIKVLAHYYAPENHAKFPKWPVLVTTDGNIFYLDVKRGEVIARADNRDWEGK